MGKISTGNNILFTKLYLEVIKFYLKIEFDTSKSQGHYSVSLIHFTISKTEKLEVLRQTIWENLFSLYNNIEFQSNVINVINNYISDIQYSRINNDDILKFDSLFLLKFIKKEFSPTIYVHCKIVQKYLKGLEEKNITFDKDIQQKFATEIYKISQVLDIDRFYYKKKYSDASWDEIEDIRKKNLKKFIQQYKDISDWGIFLEYVHEIYDGTNNPYKIVDSINIILLILSEENIDIYRDVFKLYVTYEKLSSQYNTKMVQNFIDAFGKENAYNLLDKNCIKNKECWLFSYYSCLSENTINSKNVDDLLKLYNEAENYIPSHFGFLEKYNRIDNNIILKVSKIIYNKSLSNKNFINSLMVLFHSHSDMNKNIIRYFYNDISFLKKIYIAYDKHSTYGDYDCETLNRILDIDPNFIVEYVQSHFDDKERKNKINYHKDMKVLWERDNYKQIINSIIEIYFKNHTKYFSIDNELLFLFTRTQHNEKIEIEEIQKQFLIEYIEENIDDIDKVKYVFDLISNFSDKLKKEFIFIFIENNSSNENIHQIIKEPSSYGWSGSAVVYWNKRKEYYESLLELFTHDIKYIEHRQYIEDIIKNYERRIISEKKREFMDD